MSRNLKGRPRNRRSKRNQLCLCGCGEFILPRNNGKYARFLLGHNARHWGLGSEHPSWKGGREAFLSRQRLYLRNWRHNNPEKYEARKIMDHALRHGLIILVLGSLQILQIEGLICGHHVDYSKPLEVTWMCCICHAKTWPRVKGKGAYTHPQTLPNCP